MRFLAFILGMLGVIAVSGIALNYLPAAWEYHVADNRMRWFVCTPILLILIAAKLFFARNPEWDTPRNFSSAIGAGVVAGSVLSLGIFLTFFLEAMNGSLDRNAASRSWTVLDVRKYEGGHPYIRLVVKNFAGVNTQSEIFWNRGYPAGWDRAGNCLIADTGPGILGLRWIANERIGPCT